MGFISRQPGQIWPVSKMFVLANQRQLFLAIDEADQLLDVGFKDDFFSLVRSWDTRRAHDDPWRKFRLGYGHIYSSPSANQ